MTYLHTHAVVWLHAGQPERFSAAVLAEIETGEVRISPAVLLEIRLLQEIGRIESGPGEILSALQRDIGLVASTRRSPGRSGTRYNRHQCAGLKLRVS